VKALGIDIEFHNDRFRIRKIFTVGSVALARHPGPALTAALTFEPSFFGMVLADPAEAFANLALHISHEGQSVTVSHVPKKRPSPRGAARAGVSKGGVGLSRPSLRRS
jgi:hypothetical protein